MGAREVMIWSGVRDISESLAGRFELIRASHWSFEEMRTAFGWDLDRYLYWSRTWSMFADHLPNA